jgi:hypothetical protein
MSDLRRRPLWGLGMGLAMGMVLLLFAGVRVGSLRFPGEITATYLLGGAIGGFAFGLCLPYARSRLGATLVGVVVVGPFFALFGTLDAFVSGDEAVSWWAYGVSGVLVGGLAGYVIRDTFHRDLDERGSEGHHQRNS